MKKIIIHRRSESIDKEVAFILLIVLLAQLITGVIFLIPPILGVIFFILELFGIGTLDNLSINWTGGNNAMSAAPLYLGLMAIAGTLMVYFAIKTFFYTLQDDKTINCLDITEEVTSTNKS